MRRGASNDEGDQPPDRRTRRASARATSGRPTWLRTKLPSTASNAPAPAGIASNEPTRNGIDGCASAARRTIEGATSMPTVSAPSAAAAAERSPGPSPTSRTWWSRATSAAPSSDAITRPVTARRNAYDAARASQPVASKRLKASASIGPGAGPAPPIG